MESSNVNGGEGCIFTAMCMRYFGENDDCEAQTVMQSFYNGYLKNSKNGIKLLKKYEKTIPEIIKSISVPGKAEICYSYIYMVIVRCVRLIKLGENERALDEYKYMIENLKVECSL